MAKPKIRFPEFTSEWVEAPFGSYIEEVKDKSKVENETTLLSSAIEGMFLNSELFGHQRGSSNIGYKKIKKGMLVLSAQNLHLGNANVNLRFDEGMVSPAYNTYLIKNCDIEYMAQWIKRDATNRFFYNATTVGASVCRRNVDWKMLYASPVAFPEIEEQRRIVHLFSTLDSRIASQEKIIANLESQKKGLMQKIFDQEIRFSTNDGTDFPEWEECQLGEKVEIQRGGSPRPIDAYITDDENGLNWIKIGDVSPETNIITHTKEKIRPEGLKKTRQVFKGDLILSNSMSFGRPYILGIDGCIHDGWLLIRDTNQVFNQMYLCYLLASPNVFSQYKRLSAGSTVQNLNSALVSSVHISIPCLEEQKKIADFFSLLDKRIDKQKRILADLKLLKKGLQQQMFV